MCSDDDELYVGQDPNRNTLYGVCTVCGKMVNKRKQGNNSGIDGGVCFMCLSCYQSYNFNKQ